MTLTRTLRRVAGTSLALAVAAGIGFGRPTTTRADEPAAPAADLIGQPASVAVEPADPSLVGRRATAQLIATATDPDGSVRDLTRALELVEPQPRGRDRLPERAGRARRATARRRSSPAAAASRRRRRSASTEMGEPAPVSFRHDVIPAFSQAGCNMGACHGTPTGKGGFRLSLRGYLPDQDYLTLSREAGGRRINTFAADTSMILRKPLGEIAHEGGLRLSRGTKTYEFLHDWIAEGAKDDPDVPGRRQAGDPARRPRPERPGQHASRSSRSSTTPTAPTATSPRSATTTRSNPEIAEVDADGYVAFKQRGEVAVIAHYLDLVANVRLTHLVEVPGFQVAEVPQDNLVDQAVFAKLNRMRIAPSEPCTDEEFVRRVYLDTIGVLPTPEEVEGVPRRPRPEQRTQARRRPARPARVLRLLDAQVRRRAPLQQPADPAEGGLRLPPLDSSESLQRNKPMDQFVRELLTADGSTFKNPAANYYRISRDPERLGRDHRAALPGRPHPVRQVPQPPVRALDAGRLLRLRRLLLPGPPEEGRLARRGGRSSPPTRATSASRGPAR